MTRSKKAAKKLSPAPVIDPYLPRNGNFGYRVSRYELELEYKVAINRLAGSATITAVTLSALRTFTLDLADTLAVSRVSVNGRRPAQYRRSAGKLSITLPATLPSGAAMTIAVRYNGTPRPIDTEWGEVGFEELSDGALVAGQPNGAASWFPCDDHPSSKASYRIQIGTDSPYYALANGDLVSRRARAGQTVWTYELAEPTSSYLITLQIGMYESQRLTKSPVPMNAVLPARLRREFDDDFEQQPQMMKLFIKLFGPYPLASGYTVVVTDDDLEIPLEAQGISIFGANHCDGQHGAERLIAHELAHQWFGNSVTARRWRDIWLHEGFACYAEWLWSEHSGGRSAAEWAEHYHERLRDQPQDLLLSDPGPEDMFDDRVYKRGALTLHVLRTRIGDLNFFALLRDWTARYRHSTAFTGDFTGLAAGYTDEPLQPLWQAWLYSKELPDL
ncbi:MULTISPECIES: M1 family metallopeptidase [unclassified Mycolicibacterium]|uniref:M1 family metallopeptidase n=1 Tax=unclassified Mycolicibacterium TaxID=2636767 RepID=UPI001305BDCB|nr:MULTISPECIES: M1 family metallopeptidase [unclassified Mycolicibacterium]MUL84147.1 M1 family metallopeptidase [Mycolicibacterium sp. CBMA 329]MUL89787.1 M1 family metallopeptidase [Mycolicibacterium sp. CBMA 331]MUL99961.1 M1 family metallopeptidase [Mycolicibacterium sp. CBMA 334]MUM27114.1 M1 family metallopeptidase [Mycolicibacterium sp. CBMA 295]MUM39302.1 M1 family metallopeptidase [Mycolicibacterium sp. CBMA 247]